MHRHLLIVTTLALLACAGSPAVRLDDQGVYRFPDRPFQVSAPLHCIENPAVREETTTVGFTSRRGGWRASGDYRVEVHNAIGSGRDGERFLAATRRAYQTTMESVGNQVLLAEDIEVNGRTAFRGVTSDESKALMIATNILFDDYIVIAHLIYPARPGELAVEDLPWDCYRRFVESVTFTGKPTSPPHQ